MPATTPYDISTPRAADEELEGGARVRELTLAADSGTDGSESDTAAAEFHGRRSLRRGLLTTGLLFGVAFVAVFALRRRGGGGDTGAAAQESVGLDAAKSLGEAMATIGELGEAVADTAKAIRESEKTLEDLSEGTEEAIKKAQEDYKESHTPEEIDKEAIEKSIDVPPGQPPTEDMHDGNKCPDGEEQYANLCYKKCEDLTKDAEEGPFPIRTSAWSCCKEKPCGFVNQRLDLGMCSGFDVSGDTGVDTCPHREGACLMDEEMLNSVCYKKCAIVAGIDFPFRMTSMACCKSQSRVVCEDAANFVLSADYAKGFHMPDPALTESV